jgi:hypothetical protein
MPGSSDPILTFDRYSGSTRIHFYLTVARTHFSGPTLKPGDDRLPYTAEAAGLTVIFAWGRWFAIWNRLEVAEERPESERVEVLRIKPSAEHDLAFMLHEV